VCLGKDVLSPLTGWRASRVVILEQRRTESAAAIRVPWTHENTALALVCGLRSSGPRDTTWGRNEQKPRNPTVLLSPSVRSDQPGSLPRKIWTFSQPSPLQGAEPFAEIGGYDRLLSRGDSPRPRSTFLADARLQRTRASSELSKRPHWLSRALRNLGQPHFMRKGPQTWALLRPICAA